MTNLSALVIEDIAATKNSENLQSGVKPNTFRPDSDLPPPYTVIDVAPSPAADIVHSPPEGNQVVTQQTIVVLKKTPVYVNCPNCQRRMLTSVQYVNTQKTHMLVGFICGLTVWCMLCCLSVIPYAIPICKNADHYCSNCNYFIGTC